MDASGPISSAHGGCRLCDVRVESSGMGTAKDILGVRGRCGLPVDRQCAQVENKERRRTRCCAAVKQRARPCLESAEAPGQVTQNEACEAGEPKTEDVGVPPRREAVHVLRVFVVSPQEQSAKENAVSGAPSQKKLRQLHGETELLAVSTE